jgi:hypothetical protein
MLGQRREDAGVAGAETMNPRDNISSHYTNDRDDLYRFVRDSKIPLGYFDRKRLTADQLVVWTCIICGLIAVIWGH